MGDLAEAMVDPSSSSPAPSRQPVERCARRRSFRVRCARLTSVLTGGVGWSSSEDGGPERVDPVETFGGWGALPIRLCIERHLTDGEPSTSEGLRCSNGRRASDASGFGTARPVSHVRHDLAGFRALLRQSVRSVRFSSSRRCSPDVFRSFRAATSCVHPVRAASHRRPKPIAHELGRTLLMLRETTPPAPDP